MRQDIHYGGHSASSARWGIERQRGDRVDHPEYNTFNFTGESPWSGEQLNEINTRPEWRRHFQGQ